MTSQPVVTIGPPVAGQMYYAPDDLFVVERDVESFTYGAQALIDHPQRGRVRVARSDLREVTYV